MPTLQICTIFEDYQNAAFAVANRSALNGQADLRRPVTGKLGARCTRIGQTCGMEVAGWTRTDLSARAAALDVTPLSETRGFVSVDLIAAMKPDALLFNTARGPIVDEAALSDVLEAGRLPNVLPIPHAGYVTEENYRVYYADTVEDVRAWPDGAPGRVLS